MAPRRWVVAIPLLVVLLYLAHENFTSGRDTRPSAALVSSTSLSLPASDLASVPAAVATLSPPPPPAAAATAALVSSSSISVEVAATATSPPPPVCHSLSCARRFAAEEPADAALSFQPGINWKMGGVELDDADGKNDGTIKGQQYFECAPKHGVMVREADVDVLVSA